MLILDYAKTHRYGLAVALLIEYGFSRSELLGITWEDIDFDTLSISINKGVAIVINETTQKHETVVGDVKNAYRKRIVPIVGEVSLELLKQNKKDSGYVIHKSDENVCSPRTWNRRQYGVFMKDMQEHYKQQDIDIPIFTPHELRHTRASLWVNGGKNIFAVANFLGHADLKMLRERYAHPDVESTRKMLE